MENRLSKINQTSKKRLEFLKLFEYSIIGFEVLLLWAMLLVLFMFADGSLNGLKCLVNFYFR